jgi:hypothetical protein
MWRAHVARKIRGHMYDLPASARVRHANVARTCRTRSAQQGMLLLDSDPPTWKTVLLVGLMKYVLVLMISMGLDIISTSTLLVKRFGRRIGHRECTIPANISSYHKQLWPKTGKPGAKTRWVNIVSFHFQLPGTFHSFKVWQLCTKKTHRNGDFCSIMKRFFKVKI